MFYCNPSQAYLPAIDEEAFKSTPLSLKIASLISAPEISWKRCILSKLN